MEVLEGRWEDADHGLYADNFPIFNSNVVRRPSPSSSTTGQLLSPLGNVTSSPGAPNSTHSFLANTSIAATSCPNSDRWVFSQDIAGDIRGAQHVHSNSIWSFPSTSYNFTPAKLGIALGASCFDVPAMLDRYYSTPSPGLYISHCNPYDFLFY